MTEVDKLIQSVESARAAMLTSISGVSESRAAAKPAADQWSIVENVEHLYLAEMSGIAKIWAALDSVKSGKAWTEARPNQGKKIEAIIATTWKPKEAAPPIATPHIGGPLSFWVSATNSLTGVLAQLGRGLQGVDLESIVFPHFLSGPLDGRQRLEFIRFHIERHQQQINQLLK